MRLHNYTVLYLSGAMFVVLGVWAAVFYFNMLDEIQDSIDDGLENTKLLVITKAFGDTSLLYKDNFWESNYRIREVRQQESVDFTDRYSDTLMYTQNERDFEPFRMLTTIFRGPNGKYYKLRVISSMVEEDDLIEDLLYSLLALYAILIVSMVVVNNFLLRRIWRSFYRTIDRLKGYNISDAAEIDFGETGVLEFRRLQQSLKELIRTNRETFRAQKQFIENAAHELQTPLAISINKLELMAEKNGFSAEQTEKIGEVVDSLERLTRLNKSLLLLSKIENRQFPDTEAVDLAALAHRVADDFKDLAEFKSVCMVIETASPCTVHMNRSLAEVLVTNLIKNAVFHNTAGGEVKVTTGARFLRITNPGSAPLDAGKIFGRFYKDSAQTQSTGLGLAIVQSIVSLYGFRIRYAFGGGHHFTVDF